MDSDGIQLSDLHIHSYSPAGNEEDKHGEWLNGPAHFDLTLVSIELVLGPPTNLRVLVHRPT